MSRSASHYKSTKKYEEKVSIHGQINKDLYDKILKECGVKNISVNKFLVLSIEKYFEKIEK